LSGRGLCDELITRPEESCRLWRVVVCDLETSWMRSPWPTRGSRAKNKKKIITYTFYICTAILQTHCTNGVKAAGAYNDRFQTSSIWGLWLSGMLMRRWSVFGYRRSRTIYRSHIKGKEVQCWSSWTLRTRQIGCAETSVGNCQPSPCNVLEGEVSDVGTFKEEKTYVA